MRKLKGFSLMEMMVVLLIVSIVAAASAPMVNKKIVGVASEKSPWVWTGTSQNITYNPDAAIRTASVGITNPPATADKARFYIDTKKSGNYIPHLAFGTDQSANNVMKLIASKNNVWFSTEGTTLDNVQNSVVIGSQAKAANHTTVVVGRNAFAEDVDSIAIGYNARVSGASEQSIAIGPKAVVTSRPSVALGWKSQVSGNYSVAIGGNSNARGYNSVSIGANAYNYADDTVAVGSRANARGYNSVSIGANAYNYAVNTVAIGKSANARGNYSMSLGANSYNYAENTIAIGPNANVCMPRGIAIGQNAKIPAGNSVQARAIAIGYNAYATNSDSIAIGGKYGTNASRATGTGAIAIGATVEASGYQSIAIGGTANNTTNVDYGSAPTTRATGWNAMALGTQAYAPYSNSTAVGAGAAATTSNQVVLGRSNDIVYIPGKLVVNGMAVLGYANGASEANRSYATVIRSIRAGGIMEVLDRDGDGDWDAVAADNHNRVNYSWASVCKSDKRLKNVGKAFTAGLDEIKKLELFNYTFKKDPNKTPRVGVMAQDLQKVFPNAVFQGDDGFLRIRMEDMFYALINAVKENDKRITALEKENKELKARLEAIEKKLK